MQVYGLVDLGVSVEASNSSGHATEQISFCILLSLWRFFLGFFCEFFCEFFGGFLVGHFVGFFFVGF